MVKRAKTPEGPEPCKYYTCWKPYPENADFELSEDYIKFSRWIANVLGNSGPLYALYYKPRVSAVVFSVDKTYPHPERLLGEHRWNEFLQRPDKSEVELKSQIFYCTYSTEREVQKDGWKEIPVREYFFNDRGRFTKVPYPTPHWCRVPSENMAEKPLCRPLPILQVPKPLQASKSVPKQRPVVGSSDWAQVRDKNANSKSTPSPTGASGGHTGSAQSKVSAAAKGKGTKADGIQASFPPLLSPASPAGNPTSAPRATSAHSVWANKPLNVKSATPSPLSAAPSTPHIAWKTKPSTSRTDHMARTSSSSSQESDTVTATSSAPSSPSPSLHAQGQVTVNLDITEYDDDDEETYYEDWETASAYQPSEAPAPAVRVGTDKSNRWEYPPFLAAIERGEEELVKPAEQTNLWADAAIISPSTGSAAAAEAHAIKSNEVVCPVHKGKCKKGICEKYKELVRAHRKKKKEEDRIAKKKQKKEERMGGGEKKDGGASNETGTAAAAVDTAKKNEEANKVINQYQYRNKKPMSKPLEDYSDGDDIPNYESRRTGGKKFTSDEDFYGD